MVDRFVIGSVKLAPGRELVSYLENRLRNRFSR
jgi:hypothetical protein